MVVSPRPAVSLGSRPLSASGVQSRVCHAPVPAFAVPLVRVGCVELWRLDQVYFETRLKVTNRYFVLCYDSTMKVHKHP